jgi:SAM-dependent methyltransferase
LLERVLPRFLHVGCGPKRKDSTTSGFNRPEWEEIRFDIDPAAHPDLLGSMTDLRPLTDESVDAVFSSHNIEHLYAHEAPVALAEFRRVLAPDGFLVLTCPDLQSVAALIAEDRLREPAYVSRAGPITPHDILYGHGPSMERGNLFMAHRCGFTRKTLAAALQQAGFPQIAGQRRGAPSFDLWVVATKTTVGEARVRALIADHFPQAAAPAATAPARRSA